MSTQHTPGPWVAEVMSPDARENERPWVYGAQGNRQYAALSCGDTQAEAVANARLVAAAPELLTALTQLVDDMFEMTGGGTNASIAAARSAIAKATGAS